MSQIQKKLLRHQMLSIIRYLQVGNEIFTIIPIRLEWRNQIARMKKKIDERI